MRQQRSLVLASLCAIASLGVVACGDDGGSGAGGNNCNSTVTPEARAKNQAVFDALSPSCAGCHATGSRGYFASIEAFESLLVYEPTLVVPGDPDGSELIRLLEGNGTRAFTQMPIAGPTYAELAESGAATLKMPALRTWVAELEAASKDERPSIDAPRITRLEANDVVRALYLQLGLSDADFFTPASSYDIEHKSGQNDNLYPITSFDSLPAPYEGLPAERFASLGGGSAMMQVKSDRTTSPSFLGTLTQTSQAWCRLALDKPNNAALLPAGATLATSAEDPAAVKAILRHWFLHFHAEQASDAEVESVYQNVFLPLEAETDAKTGYVGACSSFIRHPDWIFY